MWWRKSFTSSSLGQMMRWWSLGEYNNRSTKFLEEVALHWPWLCEVEPSHNLSTATRRSPSPIAIKTHKKDRDCSNTKSGEGTRKFRKLG